MKTIPSALCIDKETNSQEILTIKELILKDTENVNLNNKFYFFATIVKKVQDLVISHIYNEKEVIYQHIQVLNTMMNAE